MPQDRFYLDAPFETGETLKLEDPEFHHLKVLRIAPGEEITMDYATFCNEHMEEFECFCGASECRKTIRGTDSKEPFMERYGDHVSDYVRTRRLSGP